MYIDRILSPIETLGPGNRLVIWTRGCTKHCFRCANPELWDTKNAPNYPVDDIIKIIKNIYNNEPFDGVTISGGDPLEQIDDLIDLLEQIKLLTSDILVYTGFYLEEIEMRFDSYHVDKIKDLVTVLIDGPYIDELNSKDIVLRGSSNQNVHIFRKEYVPLYETYLNKGRKIQNVYMENRLISVGIHDRKGEES